MVSQEIELQAQETSGKKDRGRKANACSGSLVLRRQEGKDASRKSGTWKPARPVPVSPGANSANTLSLDQPCPQVQPAPPPESGNTSQVPCTLFWVLECAGPPLWLTFQLLCSAESSQPCQTTTGNSGATPQLLTPQQGKNWLCKAMAGKIIMRGGAGWAVISPSQFLCSILCRDP